MATIRLAEGGKEFRIPHSMLKSLAAECPEGSRGAEIGRAPDGVPHMGSN